MKTLFVLRHAKSDWSDPSLADRDRPLAPRGRRAASALEKWWRAEAHPVDLVLCSTAQRTRETLAALAPALPTDVEIAYEDELYGADVEALRERLRQVEDRHQTVMVVGHNPEMQDLVLTLAADGTPRDLGRLTRKLPTGAVAELQLDIDSWRWLADGSARLVSFTRPKDLA